VPPPAVSVRKDFDEHSLREVDSAGSHDGAKFAVLIPRAINQLTVELANHSVAPLSDHCAGRKAGHGAAIPTTCERVVQSMFV
jgi:hypothetical protein